MSLIYRTSHYIVVIYFWLIAAVQASNREGDLILGGLFPVNFQATASGGQCGELNTKGLGRALSMIFAIEKLNNNSNILPNITLRYDIRMYCENVTEATQMTYDLVTEDGCCRNMAQREMGNKSIVALIGPEESTTVLAIGGFLQIFNVSGISGTTTIPELSPTVKHLYRTVPPDTFRVKAMVDIIEHFNWTYVAAVGIYNSYGKSGVWGLVKEAGERNNSFRIAMTEFITDETQFSVRALMNLLPS